jgi:hypothetical protein
VSTLLLAAGGREAHAQSSPPDCPGGMLVVEGPGPDQGAQAAQLLLRVFGAELGANKILWVGSSSCQAITDFVQRQPVGKAGDDGYILDGTSAAQCLLEAPVTADFAVSELSGDTCVQNLGTPTSAMWQANSLAHRDFLGPVQVTSLLVPAASSQRSISADAAYVLFGFAGAAPYGIAPWVDRNSMLVPLPNSGPRNVLATAIGLPPMKWQVPSTFTTTKIVTGLLGAQNAEATIALVANDTADPLGTAVIPLAYQQTGQRCGYTPSSDTQHHDFINVRQGRYALWSPLHVIMALDSLGQIVDHTGQPDATLAAIAAFMAATGPTPPGVAADMSDAASLDGASDSESGASDAGGSAIPAFDPAAYFEDVSRAGFVPWCAMQVARASDLGPEMSYQPAAPCGCAFESLHGATLAACSACREDADCNGAVPKCRFGYCEVQ